MNIVPMCIRMIFLQLTVVTEACYVVTNTHNINYQKHQTTLAPSVIRTRFMKLQIIHKYSIAYKVTPQSLHRCTHTHAHTSCIS